MNDSSRLGNYHKPIPSLDDIPLRFQNLGAITYIGSGSISHVFKIIGEKDFALKVVQCGNNNKYFERLQYELRIMEELNSESCVVRPCDYEIVSEGQNKTVYLLEEFHSTMFKYLYRTSFNVMDVLQLTINICDALLVLKNHGILHLDVKPDNIFIDNESNVRIGDFSHSLFIQDVPLHHNTRGTLSFMAPEVYRDGLCSEQSDVYSLGLVLYTLFNDTKLPFMKKDSHDMAIYKRLAGKRLPDVYTELTHNAADDKINRIIRKACSFNCADRYKGFADFKSDLSNLLMFVKTTPDTNTSLYMPDERLYLGGSQQVIYVLQTTASMAGQPIDELNYIVHKTSEAINKRAEGEVEIIESALVYGDKPKWVSMNESTYDNPKVFTADGRTSIGAALNKLNKSGSILSAGSNLPIIIFVLKDLDDSDFETELSKCQMNPWFSRSIKISFMVGNQDDRKGMKRLTGSSGAVLSVNEIDSFNNLFDFIFLPKRGFIYNATFIDSFNDDDTLLLTDTSDEV